MTSVFNKRNKKEFDFSNVSGLIGDHFDLERLKSKGQAPAGFRCNCYQVQMVLHGSKVCWYVGVLYDACASLCVRNKEQQ